MGVHRSIWRGKKKGKNMLEKIVIIVAIIVVVIGSAIAWWYENGPDRKDKTDKINIDK